MFMQSFENSSKQQKRRSERQLAMQRMQAAASASTDTDGISMTSMKSILEEDETKQDPSTSASMNVNAVQHQGQSERVEGNVDENPERKEARVSQLLRDIVAPTSNSSSPTPTTMQQRGYHTQYSAGVAPNGSRFSMMEKTAQEFMWDDGSVASGASRLSGKNVNLHDIKNSLQQTKQPSGKWSRNKSARWSAINNNNTPVSEGLWSSLPLFGRGQPVAPPPQSDSGSKSSREEEGERLLGASQRPNNKRVSLTASTEAQEYGEINSDDDDVEQRRVVLDRHGNVNYDDERFGDLHARRRHIYVRSYLKRSAKCIMGFVGCIFIMVMFGALITRRLMRTAAESHDVASHAQDTEETISDDGWYQQEEAPNSERFEEIKAHLLKTRVTHPSAFDDIHSAQYAALRWLAYDDPRQLDPTNEYIVQRYGLVTLWYSTTETEYEWHLPAEYSQSEQGDSRRRLDTGTSIWTRHENWGTEKSVCDWEGVKCKEQNENNKFNDESYDGDVTYLELRDNNLHGLICKEIYTTLPHLEHADLSNNGFTGILSSEIGLWNKLSYLNFTSNRIGGSLPREIGVISPLKVFHFADNLLGETIPHTIGDLSFLRDLDLSGNELKGTIPYEIGGLEGLISLDLASNQLRGEIPHEFSKLSLVTFDVGNNKLGGPLVTELGLMSHLEVLRLNDNRLTGEIPTELGQLVHLNELNIESNTFEGSVPSQFSELVALDYLLLANNQLEGQFPIELTKLTGLQKLDLSNNLLKGQLPNLFFDMKNLKELNLAKNNFSGSIPTVIGSLFKLESIQLETNSLTGSIPVELGELTKLKKLIVHNNDLTGNVSPQICKLVEGMFLSLISADCAGESASIHCDCCQCHVHENIIHAGS